MTNKPMLSVDRELLERAVSAVIVARGPGSPTERDLRAILDKPAECRCKRYGKDNPHWPCPVHAEPAAQHQGEPFTWWIYPEGGDPWGDGIPADEPYDVDMRDASGSRWLSFQLYRRPLEQPAPAIKLHLNVSNVKVTLNADGSYTINPSKQPAPVPDSRVDNGITYPNGHSRPAYCAAPVAVVMPERKVDPGMIAGLTSRWVQGWNEALDEVARLNGVKP